MSSNGGYTNLVLDLFSGTGSATEPFVECGKHRVVRIDCEVAHRRPDIRADVRRLPIGGTSSERPEFVWASPPCPEFSKSVMPWYGFPTPSLELVFAAISAVRELRPRYWLLENVTGAQRWIGRSVQHWGPYHLWGWFPRIRVPESRPLKKMRIWGATEDWSLARSEIPRSLAEAVHKAVCHAA